MLGFGAAGSCRQARPAHPSWSAPVSGSGIAQVFALGVSHLIASGNLVELYPDWPDKTYPLYATHPSRRLAPAAVEAFLEFCTEICRAHAV
ncbi:LysR substrate-binding domain-containing protein [Achromobacter sp. NFACC18-2]|uniref:LysR substrate-binding domain-containing protein n=1 Tax=Achromobacter sp. NFACC18-2 TaxID=1564112 RepID=UPI000B85BB4F|nr:LysR substrate-binding domain-containing protein [Achromobacter sp. NFACC18-2]